MKLLLFVAILLTGLNASAQSLGKIPDSIRNKMNNANSPQQKTVVASLSDDDSWIKDRLVNLALKNPEITAADANIRIAEISRRKANSSLLSSVNVGANINEFVVKNSVAASFFPKYNLGVSIPLDLFARDKAARKTADQQITINKALKDQQVKQIRTEVLIRYENYKEKKDLVQLQKESMEDDFSAYERAQKDYADENITLEDMTRIYKNYIEQKARLVTRQRELNVAVLELEDMIGMPLQKALSR